MRTPALGVLLRVGMRGAHNQPPNPTAREADTNKMRWVLGEPGDSQKMIGGLARPKQKIRSRRRRMTDQAPGG